MVYTAVVQKSRYGYDISCPALPGCHCQGESRDEALSNIKGAIATYLKMIRQETKGERTARVVVA